MMHARGRIALGVGALWVGLLGQSLLNSTVRPSASFIGTASQTSVATLPEGRVSVPSGASTGAAEPLPISDRSGESACFSLDDGPPPALDLPYRLLYRRGDRIIAYDFQTGRRRLVVELPTGSYVLSDDDAAVSPDGRWLAFLESRFDDELRLKTRTLHLLSKSGRSLDMTDWPEHWQWLLGWLDTSRLMLWMPHLGRAQVTVLDPFTGAAQRLTPDLPGLTPSRWTNPESILYNATLDRVTYPSREWPFDFSVMDLEANRLMWVGEVGSVPVWSPDGSTLAMAYSVCGDCRALITLDQKGAVTFLTDPTDPNDETSFVDVWGISWSPDSKTIAAWGEIPSPDISSTSTWNLAIVNVQGRSVRDTCLEFEGYFYGQTVWSPDGDWLAFADWERSPGYWTELVTTVVDLRGERAYKLRQGATPFGWMAVP